jgi:peptidoglycan/LPS O-acetylase OafA/YrhL
VNTPSPLRYRPGFDGLRAFAVVAVMLYHGDVPWVRGGFLGVDVFFVLSGYLITSLLLIEWDRWGAIDLAAFWLRRARRLLPALLVVIVAVTLFTVTLAPASQRDGFRGDAVATLLYVSNWRFIATGQSYFAQFEAPSPLLHTWSLGIEEQWYILLPVVLGFVLARWRALRRWLVPVFCVAAAASAVEMAYLYSPAADPSRVYYGTDTRAQSLLVGAALAALLVRRTQPLGRKANAVVQSAGVLAGLALLVAFARVQDTQEWLFRGGFAVVAVLAVLVIAAAATSDLGPVSRLLSWRPLVVIGLVSYGLYLWHWPVYLALTPLRTGLSGPALLLLRLFVTGVLAAVSYVFVEQPVRRVRLTVGAGRLGSALLTSSVAVLAVVLLGGQVLPAPAAAAGPEAAVAVTPAPATAGTGTTNVFLLGDSVAYNLRSEFPADLEPALRVTGSTQLGCGLLPDQLTAEGKVITPGADCVSWHQRIGTEINFYHPDIGVLFVGSWEQYDRIVNGKILKLGTPEFEAHVDAELSVLLAQLDPKTRPVAVMNDPCHLTPDFGLGPEPRVVNDENRVRLLNGIVARFVAAQGPAVHLLDFHGFLCSGGYTATKDGVTLRTDGLHYTPQGARLIWTWLGPALLALKP